MKLRLVLATAIATASAGSVVAETTVEQLAAEGVQKLAFGSDFVGDLKNSVGAKVDSYVEQGISNWLGNTEVSIQGITDGKPTIGILTVQPLYESQDLLDTVFTQASLFNYDGRQTVNIGLGYRKMSPDERWLYGINAFYDHEFPYDHQRSSIGLEARSSVIEFNANKYFGLSDWKSGANSLDEKALGGYDIEAGLTLPYMPGGKIYYKQFQWDAENGATDLKGNTTSLKVSGDLLVPGLTFEVGVIDYDGNRDNKEFVQLTYKYTPGGNKVRPIFSNDIYQFTSMKERRLDKVRRENKIVVQKQGRGTISFR